MSVRWVKNMKWKNHWRSWRIPSQNSPFQAISFGKKNSLTIPKPQTNRSQHFWTDFATKIPLKKNTVSFFPRQQNFPTSNSCWGYHRRFSFVFCLFNNNCLSPTTLTRGTHLEWVDGTQKGHLQLRKSCGVVCHLPCRCAAKWLVRYPPWNIGKLYSNRPFSGAMLVSGRVTVFENNGFCKGSRKKS